MSNHQSKLPSYAELFQDPQSAFKDDPLKALLYNPPNMSWVKQHPTIKVENEQKQKVPLLYLPIDKVEFLLTRIFPNWKVEVISYKVMFQSVAVQVRLHVQNPLTLEWTYQDGLGSAPVQVDAGKSAADLSAIKSSAVMMALPSAQSYATKDAAEKLGPIFGKDLNRKDIILYSNASEPQDYPAQVGYQQPDQAYGQPVQAPQPQSQPQGAYNPQPLPMQNFQQYAETVPHPYDTAQAVVGRVGQAQAYGQPNGGQAYGQPPAYGNQPQAFTFNPAVL